MQSFKRQTYSGQVVAFIKQCILEGELAPGDQVKEVMLSERLGISRAPIREALQILVQDGLITAEPQKGRYIRKMSGEEIANEYAIGGILEGAGVASGLVHITPADMNRFLAMLEEMHRLAAEAKGLHELADIDEAFHDALLSHCANRRLASMGRTFCTSISKFLFYNRWDTLYTPQEFVARHSAIVDALQHREPTAVEQVIREHYRESGLRMAQFGTD